MKFDEKRCESKLKVVNEENAGEKPSKPSWIVSEIGIIQDKPNVSLFKFCTDNLSIEENGKLKLTSNTTITVMELICDFYI